MRRIPAFWLSLNTLSLAHTTQVTVVVCVTPLFLGRMGLVLKCVDHAHILMVLSYTGRLWKLRVKLLNFCEINRLREDAKVFVLDTRLLDICVNGLRYKVGVTHLFRKMVHTGFNIKNLWFLSMWILLDVSSNIFVADVEVAVQVV